MITTLTLAPAALLLSPLPQDAAPKLDPFHRVDAELVGMDIWTRAGQDEGERTDLGDVQDFIIDPRSNNVRGVVISSGGLGDVGDTLRRIEFSDLTWHTNADGALEAWVQWTEEQFEKIPEFRPELLKKDPKKAVDASVRKTSDDEAPGMQIPVGPRTPRVCMATELTGLDVFGPGELRSFAVVSDVVLDCEKGSLAYLTVSYDDANYLMPAGAMKVRSVYTDPRPEEDELAAVAGMNANGMRSAPTVDPERNRTARHSAFREQVDRFFANVMNRSENDIVPGETRSKGKPRKQPAGGKR